MNVHTKIAIYCAIRNLTFYYMEEYPAIYTLLYYREFSNNFHFMLSNIFFLLCISKNRRNFAADLEPNIVKQLNNI